MGVWKLRSCFLYPYGEGLIFHTESKANINTAQDGERKTDEDRVGLVLKPDYILKGLPRKVPFLAQSRDFFKTTNQEQPNSEDYSETSVPTYQTSHRTAIQNILHFSSQSSSLSSLSSVYLGSQYNFPPSPRSVTCFFYSHIIQIVFNFVFPSFMVTSCFPSSIHCNFCNMSWRSLLLHSFTVTIASQSEGFRKQSLPLVI